MSRVKVNISSRELKHKDNDVIPVTSKGANVGDFNYSDYDYIIANFVTPEQVKVIVESNYNTRSATQIRTAATLSKSPYKVVSDKMKASGFTEVEIEKVNAYIDKLAKANQ